MKEEENNPRIVIVEDDPDVAQIIVQVLSEFAFQTLWCHSASEFLRQLPRHNPDLCIIDLGLPDMDGIEVMKKVKEQSNCGILILTGRAHVSDRVMGLELGADDYMLKPFEPRELVARARSILRRKENPSTSDSPTSVAEFAGWKFYLANNALISPKGEEFILSTTEAELLRIFVQHPNRILGREKLTGGNELTPMDRSIDVRISRLRRKLESDSDAPAIIKTVYGAGYLFLANVSWHSA